VQALFGRRLHATKVVCGAFSTHCLVKQQTCQAGIDGFEVYSWGNDSQQQCAGEEIHSEVLFDRHLPNCLSCYFNPLKSNVPPMTKLAATASNVCAVDVEGYIWSWGRLEKPHKVEALQPFVCQEVDVGETDGYALCSLYSLEVESSRDGNVLTFVGLPADRLRGESERLSPTSSGSSLHRFLHGSHYRP